MLIIQDVNFKEARLDLLRLAVGWQGFGSWEPHVELCQPVLKSINLSESQARKSALRSQLRAELLQLFRARKGSPSSSEGARWCLLNSYRHNGKDSFGWRVAEEDVDEGDHLQSFPQTHAVGQDTAKATTGLKPLQGLNQVIIQEPDPANLARNTHKCQEGWQRPGLWVHLELVRSERADSWYGRLKKSPCTLPSLLAGDRLVGENRKTFSWHRGPSQARSCSS